MEQAQWQRLQELFAAAHSLHADARERLLDAHAEAEPDLVAQVRSLLEADATRGVMDALAPRLPSLAAVLVDRAPDRIGAYRLAGELGRGGMGVVYLGERADGQFHQRVAIKLIGSTDRDDPRHQRFLAERQILAALIHPNIARLLDGGVTEDGRPYIVMEYVEGVPITTFCDAQGLDVRARLRLFGEVCAAVQHAHQNLVIHRDLKPSNILVSPDGRVHLLDFGIAKLLNPALPVGHSPQTLLESRAMTLEYASPEQLRGDPLTTASDIYSLGVLLYELLSGHKPYRLTTGSSIDVATAVCEQDPERPSVRALQADREVAERRGTTPAALARQLEGDLDGVVLMALRKEPARRYASADMLRQDIDRHLGGLAVLAHRGSRRYRIGKFVRRHRIEVAAAGIVLATLVSGLSLSVFQGRRVSRERDRAEQALTESEGVTHFLLELFRTGDPGEAPPGQLSALELLERGARRADELSDQPIVQARLLDAVGQMSLHLGRLDDAQRRLEQAVAIRRSSPGASSDLASSLIHLAWALRSRGEYQRARGAAEEALAIRQRTLPPGHPAIAEALFELGWVTGGPEQERLYTQVLTILPDTGPSAERRVAVLQGLTTNLRRQGRLDEAVAVSRDALLVAERALGTDHPVTGYAMIHLGDHVRDIEGDLVTAERLYRRGLELMTLRYGEQSIRLLHGLNSLAALLGERGDNEAEQQLRRALAIRQTASSPEHPQAADQLDNLARELLRQGRLDEAHALARQAMDLSIRTLGAEHAVITGSRLPLLAEVYDRQGRFAEADEAYRTALDENPLHGVVPGQLRRSYGRMLLNRGDFMRAEEQLLQSLELMETAYGGRAHPNLQETKRALMQLYGQWGKPDLVEKYRVPPGRYVPY